MTASIDKGPLLGQRHVQILLLFLALTVNLIAKFNIGVAVVAMTNAETTNPDFPEYDWNEMEKSLVLSSFFWGYFITQFPGGYLCRRLGARRTMFISTLGSALFALPVPYVVDWGGWQIYCAIRVIQGLFQGFLFPCVHAHLAVWCPVNERNRLGALASTGYECGTVLAMFLSGIIAASSMGWPGISYVSCILGVVWCILWLLFSANIPKEAKYITDAERLYIESSHNNDKVEEENNKSKDSIPVPWKAIFTSWPFWALLVARTAQSWGFSTLQAEIPSYMNGVLNMDMKSNAVFSALPYFAMWCMSYAFLILSDISLQRNILSLNTLRKLFNSLAFWIPALGLIAVGFVDESQKTVAVILMTANIGINAGHTIGSALNTIDLSPNHAGILMGIINTSANVIPILTPLLVGVIVTDEHDRSQWQIIFIISAIVFGLGNLFYIVFGTTNRQSWDDANYLQNQDNKENNKCDDCNKIKNKF